MYGLPDELKPELKLFKIKFTMNTKSPNDPESRHHQYSHLPLNKKIKLEYLFHKDMHCIGFRYPFETSINEFIKNLDGCKFSKSNTCYYQKYDEDTFYQLIETLKNAGIYPDYQGYFQNKAIQTNRLSDHKQIKISHQQKEPQS